jgi:hypothetical protein
MDFSQLIGTPTNALTLAIAVAIFIERMVEKGYLRIGRMEREKEQNNYQTQIDALGGHAKIANEEMGKIQLSVEKIEENITEIQKDVYFIKGQLSK